MKLGDLVRIKRTYYGYVSTPITGVVISSLPVHDSPVNKTFKIKILLPTGRLHDLSVYGDDELEVLSWV